ncbi:hypothetical protein A0J57_24250 [Sphingobium sp. 22B]|uniref:hypothetical protein n=1 Tax=unclassified Sphingobium TaxID=2611147 RepID=UPI00078135F8|nr:MULTISPECIES: hypothetical protein [unclassified Sphingobium]KXU29306.1 hypothetical protein AXW74_23820 [Sphingobium sp. AM]KYC29759.1 hypothetical protein A0J57_24250 [Sphingobium sp. 22B]OAP29275.1 hypothetical protein A8O16_24640 [Sphingobium sp. 20006FA]
MARVSDNPAPNWRHHWAAHCIMAGVDLVTIIMNMGGWKSRRMVQRCSGGSADHIRESIDKLN